MDKRLLRYLTRLSQARYISHPSTPTTTRFHRACTIESFRKPGASKLKTLLYFASFEAKRASTSRCAAQPDTLACLRATDISRLDSVNQIINKEGFYGTYTFVPVVDGEFVRQDVGRSLREKKVNGVGGVPRFSLLVHEEGTADSVSVGCVAIDHKRRRGIPFRQPAQSNQPNEVRQEPVSQAERRAGGWNWAGV